MTTPQINVWASLDTEAHCERLAKQARDVEETCSRMTKMAAQLKTKAQRGCRDSERALMVLVDETYSLYSEMESGT